MSYRSISIIGLGYIGLPTAVVLASHMGHVIGVDVNQRVVDAVNTGTTRTAEPGLITLLREVRSKGQFCAVTRPEPADAFIIAVPTPITKECKPDMGYVKAAAQSISPVLQKGNLIILESTSSVGTTEQMATWLAEARHDLSFPQQAGDAADVQIAYCPERILPGKMLEELISNDRVVGGMSEKASAMAVALYKIFVKGQIVTTYAHTAEMCKLVENSFRDLNIAFANELSMICDKVDVDVWELIALANRHPRVDILRPGIGVGGHCIAIDPWFLIESDPEKAMLIRKAREVNTQKSQWVLEKIEQKITSVAETKHTGIPLKIACFGLTYKADIDDLRESPALFIVASLSKKYSGSISVVDPWVKCLPESLSTSEVALMEMEEALARADMAVFLVAHQKFKMIPFSQYTDLHCIDFTGRILGARDGYQ